MVDIKKLLNSTYISQVAQAYAEFVWTGDDKATPVIAHAFDDGQRVLKEKLLDARKNLINSFMQHGTDAELSLAIEKLDRILIDIR